MPSLGRNVNANYIKINAIKCNGHLWKIRKQIEINCRMEYVRATSWVTFFLMGQAWWHLLSCILTLNSHMSVNTEIAKRKNTLRFECCPSGFSFTAELRPFWERLRCFVILQKNGKSAFSISGIVLVSEQKLKDKRNCDWPTIGLLKHASALYCKGK